MFLLRDGYAEVFRRNASQQKTDGRARDQPVAPGVNILRGMRWREGARGVLADVQIKEGATALVN